MYALWILLLPLATGCTSSYGSNKPEYGLHLSSDELNDRITFGIFSKDVPMEGGSYRIKVKASSASAWETSIAKGRDFISVTPEGEQNGSKEITVTVSSNPDKTPRLATIIIRNRKENTETQVILRQMKKELFFPEDVDPGGDRIIQEAKKYYDETSRYNIHYMVEGANAAVLWDKKYGKNPTKEEHGFDPKEVIEAFDTSYDYMTGVLKFASNSDTYAHKYKTLIFIRGDRQGGGGALAIHDVPIVWIGPVGLQDGYRALHHEICHCFEFVAYSDGAAGLGMGGFMEMTSQWSLLRRYPDWINLERFHFDDFMDRTHLALGCHENQYHAPYILEYWAFRHGTDIISRIWQKAAREDGNDFTRAYMRITDTDQQTFNAEVFDAASRFITWDLPHIDKKYNCHGGANVHECELDKKGEVYAIGRTRCPRNYGYNGIKLNVPASGTKVSVRFKGLPGAEGFNTAHPERAEWRWGFVAVLKDGSRIYSKEKGKGTEGTVKFKVPDNTDHLWLVVAATPTPYWFDDKCEWPYEFTLEGTRPDGIKCKVNEG